MARLAHKVALVKCVRHRSTHPRFWPQFPDPVAARRSFVDVVPMKRMATAHEIGQSIVFLASDESAFITGIALPVDGGRTARS